MAFVTPLGYRAFADVITMLAPDTGSHTLLLLDGVTDVGNFATLSRSAVAFGVDALLLPKHHSVGLSPVVAKRSSGAIERLAVVQLGNVMRALEALKQAGCWILRCRYAGCHAGVRGQRPERVVLVVGAEGRGIRRLVRDTVIRWCVFRCAQAWIP